jgi:cardiolipin-specific phospholipase
LQNVAKSDPFGHRIWKTTMVQLSGKNRALNEYTVERVGEQVDETLVMLHGYGAGLGFFYKNFEPLSRLPGWRLYALDMLGMGNSSRPQFKVKARDQEGKIREAENFFVDALEEWRRARSIEKFTLLGHSMGGYLAVSYALKYPGHLNKLILVSPVGVPEDPWAVNADMPEPEESTMANEFTQDQASIASNDAANDNNSNYFRSQERKAAAQPNGKKATPPKRPLPGWLVWLWDANVSPFSLVRFAGPLGPRLASGWTSRRFNHLPPEEGQMLHTYAYNLFRQTGSGEYALPYILAPGAYARSPIINRIQDVRQRFPLFFFFFFPFPHANAAADIAPLGWSTGHQTRHGHHARRARNGVPHCLYVRRQGLDGRDRRLCV